MNANEDEAWKLCPFGVRSSEDSYWMYCEEFVHPRRFNNFTCKLPKSSVVKLFSAVFCDARSACFYAVLNNDVTFTVSDVVGLKMCDIFNALWCDISGGKHGLSVLRYKTPEFYSNDYINVKHFDVDGLRHGPRTIFLYPPDYKEGFENQWIQDQSWYWRGKLVSKTTYDAILESIRQQLLQTVTHIDGLVRIVLDYATLPDQTGHVILDNFEWHSNLKHIQPVSQPIDLLNCF